MGSIDTSSGGTDHLRKRAAKFRQENLLTPEGRAAENKRLRLAAMNRRTGGDVKGRVSGLTGLPAAYGEEEEQEITKAYSTYQAEAPPPPEDTSRAYFKALARVQSDKLLRSSSRRRGQRNLI